MFYFWCSTNSVAILAQEQEHQIQNLFPKKAAQLVEAFPMVLFSVQLLILLMVASSTRVNVEEIGHKAITQHFQDSEASEPLPQFGEASEPLPQFGEKCYEHTKAKVIGKHGKKMIRKWCADGLVCSKTTWTCKVAIMQPCNKTWIPGVSQCAGTGTYGRTTTCGKTDPHGQSFCCIKSMLPLISLSMDHQQGRRALYTKKKNHRKTANLPECCSGKGDFVINSNFFLPVPDVRSAWMCTP
jgi:hypothetical protein